MRYKPLPKPEFLHRWCQVCDHWKEYCQCGMRLNDESCDWCDNENTTVTRMPIPDKILWLCDTCKADQ